MIICGVDEVGRGPWAGPVVAAAVILPEEISGLDLRDSKKMTAKARDITNAKLQECASFAIGEASVAEIDALNIRQATHLAMRRAVMALPITPDHIDIDGRDVPADLPAHAKAIIKGDATHPHIAAASIIAKVYRDELMAQLAREYPYFAWEKNAGYGTKAHQFGLDKHGITPHHRCSFAPIRSRMTK